MWRAGPVSTNSMSSASALSGRGNMQGFWANICGGAAIRRAHPLVVTGAAVVAASVALIVEGGIGLGFEGVLAPVVGSTGMPVSPQRRSILTAILLLCGASLGALCVGMLPLLISSKCCKLRPSRRVEAFTVIAVLMAGLVQGALWVGLAPSNSPADFTNCFPCFTCLPEEVHLQSNGGCYRLYESSTGGLRSAPCFCRAAATKELPHPHDSCLCLLPAPLGVPSSNISCGGLDMDEPRFKCVVYMDSVYWRLIDGVQLFSGIALVCCAVALAMLCRAGCKPNPDHMVDISPHHQESGNVPLHNLTPVLGPAVVEGIPIETPSHFTHLAMSASSEVPPEGQRHYLRPSSPLHAFGDEGPPVVSPSGVHAAAPARYSTASSP